MRITHFDKHTLAVVREEMVKVMQARATELGIKIVPGKGTYGGPEGSLTFTFFAGGDDGARDSFAQVCSLYGLKPEHFHATFTHKGETFRIVGIERRRPKYCVRAENVATGKTLLFPESVKHRLVLAGTAPAPAAPPGPPTVLRSPEAPPFMPPASPPAGMTPGQKAAWTRRQKALNAR